MSTKRKPPAVYGTPQTSACSPETAAANIQPMTNINQQTVGQRRPDQNAEGLTLLLTCLTLATSRMKASLSMKFRSPFS
ncbi:hypothetical protein SKAU_G00160820 [Synaphobranchus kaupii]|uniref:Uncharacterized protein n=1 Tax=Synaphobranchus kaupii TaxID=118154 RepID=A0A9Q1FIH0_SYNKA|nr:hypothetical protein SKAU_G00160820 [Synaphobranchus kaupii]